MKKTYLILLFFLGINGFAQSPASELEQAYEKQSQKALNNFFMIWEKEIKPLTKSQIEELPILQQEVYTIYRVFYNPLHILPIVHGNQYNYKRPKYWVLQNQIKYQVVDDFVKDKNGATIGKNKVSADSIANFKPNIEPIKKQVYLSNTYEKIFEDFFTRKFYTVAKKDSKNNFLKRYITISNGMFRDQDGGYITTFPLILNLQIDVSMQKVVIEFRYQYGIGYTILEKNNGYWTMKETVRTLVE